jgi:hypothetical protein
MNIPFDPKPNLKADVDYVANVAKTIAAREQIEELQLQNLNDVLIALGINIDPYSLVSLENLNPEPLQILINDSFSRINNTNFDAKLLSLLHKLWDYLAEEDNIEHSELCFVLGGPNINRANEAIKLFKDDCVDKIMFTGSHASYIKETELSEAEYLASIAIEQGVPQDKILLETTSINTPENVAFGIKQLKESICCRTILYWLLYRITWGELTWLSNPLLIEIPE